MATTLLVRGTDECQPVKFDSEAIVDFRKLMDDASKLLQYSASAWCEDRAKVLRSNKIRRALANLSDPPFTRQSVTRYKREKMRRAIPWREKLSYRAWVAAGIAWLMAIIAVGLAFTTGLVGNAFSLSFGAGGIGMFAFAIFLAVLSFVAFPKAWGDNLVFVKTVPVWTETNMCTYHRAIPEFALQTAVDLKKEFPEAEFVIEEMQITQQRVVVMTLDPFLRIDLPDGTFHYLEVWNEPGFRGSREV